MKDPPGFPTAFATVAATRGALKVLGFKRTIRWAKRLGARSRQPRGAPERIVRSVAVAAAFFPGRAICLEQSVAAYVLLRRAGHLADLRVGVQPYPFAAHAWVELAGKPVLENEDDLTRFVPFPEAFA